MEGLARKSPTESFLSWFLSAVFSHSRQCAWVFFEQLTRFCVSGYPRPARSSGHGVPVGTGLQWARGSVGHGVFIGPGCTRARLMRTPTAHALLSAAALPVRREGVRTVDNEL